MPSGKTPEGGSSEPAAKADEDWKEARERQDQARWRQEALEDLIERGRANTREQAEHYLERLNSLKKVVLAVTQQVLTRQQQPESHFFEQAEVQFADHAVQSELSQAKPADVANLQAAIIDTTDPNIWDIESTTYSRDLGTTTSRERLRVAMRDHRDVLIYPGPNGEVAHFLRQHLADDQRQLLLREHRLAKDDLIGALRRRAGQLSDTVGFQRAGWNSLRPPGATS